jgi:hypothetical protein
MKTEDFDDALRRKLEGIHYQYKEDDIERIHKYVGLQQGASWLKGRRLRWLFAGSAVVVLITALLSWNIMLQYRQKQLSAEVDTLQIQLAQSQHELAITKANQATAQASGTAATTNATTKTANTEQNANTGNRLTQNNSSQSAPGVTSVSNETNSFKRMNNNAHGKGQSAASIKDINSQNNTPTAIALNNTKSRTKTHNNTNTNSYQQSNTVGVSQGNSAAHSTEQPEKTSAQNPNNGTGNAEKETGSQSNTSSDQVTNTTTNPGNTENNSSVQSKTEAPGNNSSNVTPGNSGIAGGNHNNNTSTGGSIGSTAQNKDTASSKSSANTNAKQQANTVKHYTVKDPEATAKTPAHKKKVDTAELTNASSKAKSSAADKKKEEKSSAVSNWHFLAGVGAEKENDRNGLSLLGEAFFSERWSIYSGIQFTNIGGQREMNDDHFKHPGNPYLINPYDTSVSNIDVRYRLIQLPILLTYHLPLQHHLALLFSAGTELDLISQRHLEYDQASIATGFERKVADQPIQDHFFNNVIIAVGIQKNWKHFTIDASPYISPQLMSEEYRQRDMNFGIKLRGMYSF